MPSERALALQAELQALKASRTGVRVQRAEKGAPGAPFPLAVSARVDAPQGTRVDVAALTVRLSLAPDLLLAPPPPGAARVEVAAGAGSGGAADSDLSWLATKFGAAVRISNGGQQGQSSSQGANGRGQRAPPQDAAQQGPSFSLLLSPTDPAWGQRGPVHVQGAWGPALGGGDGGSGSSGATGSLRLRVLPTPAVPRPLAARLESELARQSEAAAARPGGSGLRSALKWLEQYAGSAAAEAGGAEGSGSSGGGESDEFESGSEDGGGSSGSSSEEGSSGSGEGEGEGGGDAPTGSAPPAEASSGGGRAFGISFEGLQLDAIDALEVLEVTVQLGCSRCGEAAAARLSPYGGGGGGGAPQRGWEWRGKCGKCAQELWCSARPKIVHEANNEIAALKTEGCAPLDLLGGLFGAQCAECSASAALRGVQIGLPCSRACTHCHRPLQLVIPAVAFIPKRAPPPGQRRPKAPRGAGGGGQRGGGGGGEVVPGQPLPMLGTCKHYRHSHRWLRFPCCGTRYPCDLCHEEATDGHEMAWAKRMTCGYCSAEQALAERCATCGKRLATSAAKPSGRNTRFWEGGEGCRDPSSMSRKDPHRYRNSKSKTKSAKASRVGPKPWS